jgi:hypothetical protein
MPNLNFSLKDTAHLSLILQIHAAHKHDFLI